MSNQCDQCGSYAINHHHHGRDGSDPDLCDVCYWHTRNDRLQAELAALKAKAAVPDGMVCVNKRSLGTVLQALVNAPHYIRELQATREPAALFKDNPINVLIENYAAAPAQPQSDAERSQ